MGLFDFLKRKPAAVPDDDGPSPDYVFAHVALRQIALASPLRFLAIAASPDATKFLDSILQDVAEQCGRPVSYGGAALKIYPTRVKSYPCAVIEFPEPKDVPEVHLVALVGLIDTSGDMPPDINKVTGRYFTLEKGYSMTDTPRTVLAEWTATGHGNYGDGPEPSVPAFIEAIAEQLT